MIIYIRDIVLTPGKGGKKCAGNGEHRNESGDFIESCCEECDYYLKCFPKPMKTERKTHCFHRRK